MHMSGRNGEGSGRMGRREGWRSESAKAGALSVLGGLTVGITWCLRSRDELVHDEGRGRWEEGEGNEVSKAAPDIAIGWS